MQLEERGACVTDLAFDQWFAHECTPARQAWLEEHLRSCPRCRLRAELLEREREMFLAKAPTLSSNADRIRQLRSTQRRPLSNSGRRAALALATAATAAVVALTFARGANPAADSVERRKGGFAVGFFVKRGERVVRGFSGDVMYPGDRLRFTYSSQAPAYFALLGRDQRGSSVYFPASSRAARVEAGRDQPLDFSLELDGQIGPEQLFVVSCPEEFAPAPLAAAFTADREPPVAPTCRVERIVLNKRAAP